MRKRTLATAVVTVGIVATTAPAARARQPFTAGTRVYAGEKLTYARNGMGLKIEFGEPVAVAVSDGPQGWGYFQFPTIARSEDGRLRVDWNMGPDSVAGYGTGKAVAVSDDGGKSWARSAHPTPALGLKTANGDHIESVWSAAIPVSKLSLPEPAGVIHPTYGGGERTMYHLGELPPEVSGVPLRRRARGAAEWTDERAALSDPTALRYALNGLFPVIWLGDIKALGDGSLVAAVYPAYQMRDGKVDPKDGASVYRSTDNGARWTLQGRIDYRPDPAADDVASRRDGFTEPATELLPDGSLLCVLRTTDGNGSGPMYASRSTDKGRTWTRPKVITADGVLPRLLQLENGVLAMSSGRPGVQVRFSVDGKGERWSNAFEMVPPEGGLTHASCGYTGLLATGPNTFLVTFSDFQHPTPSGARRKAIMVREIRVEAVAR